VLQPAGVITRFLDITPRKRVMPHVPVTPARTGPALRQAVPLLAESRPHVE
jgi:hypothetical protein